MRLKSTAIHEAGHAVVACLINRFFLKVRVGKGEDGDITYKGGFRVDGTEAHLIKDLTMMMGGIAANIVLENKDVMDAICDHGADDWDRCAEMVSSFLNKEEDDDLVESYIAGLLGTACVLVSDNVAAVQGVADALMERGRLSYAQTAKLISRANVSA